MSVRGKIIIAASVVWFLVETAYGAHRRALLQILALPLFLSIVVAIVLSFAWVFLGWRQHRWRAAVPFVVCLLLCFGSLAAALSIRQRLFDWALPSYEAVVQQMQAGTIAITTNWSRIPAAEAQARLVYEVIAQRDTNGVLTVVFFTENSFPARSSGYLYSSSGAIEPSAFRFSGWPTRIQVRPEWFYVSH